MRADAPERPSVAPTREVLRMLRVTSCQLAAVALVVAAALPISCGTVHHVVYGPEEALVTVPGARTGMDEQYIVEASTSRKCQAGVRAVRNSDWELAITAFRQALAEDPDDEQAHFAIGIAYEMTGLLEKSLEHYEAAAALPRKPNPAYTMSVERVRAKLGRGS
jgi:tetratricopeptide (TPR) repeat protein